MNYFNPTTQIIKYKSTYQIDYRSHRTPRAPVSSHGTLAKEGIHPQIKQKKTPQNQHNQLAKDLIKKRGYIAKIKERPADGRIYTAHINNQSIILVYEMYTGNLEILVNEKPIKPSMVRIKNQRGIHHPKTLNMSYAASFLHKIGQTYALLATPQSLKIIYAPNSKKTKASIFHTREFHYPDIHQNDYQSPPYLFEDAPYAYQPIKIHPFSDVRCAGTTRMGRCSSLLKFGPKDGLFEVIQNGTNHTSVLRDKQGNPLGTCIMIGPEIFITARHIVNEKSLADLNSPFGNPENKLHLVEDGAHWNEDYIIIKIQNYKTDHFAQLSKQQQPPTEMFVQGFQENDFIYIYAMPERSEYMSLCESTYLPTRPGLSGAAYKNREGEIYGLHIKKCVDGLWKGEAFGVLIHTLISNHPESILTKIIETTEMDFETSEVNTRFPIFTTASSAERDEGLSLNDFNTKYHINNTYQTKHILANECHVTTSPINQYTSKNIQTPIIIEVMETNIASAKEKMELAISSNRNQKNPIIWVIGLNGPKGTLEKNEKKAYELISFMNEKQLTGACFAFEWCSTAKKSTTNGYVFPYLEARALMSLHSGIRNYIEPIKTMGPIVRGMDADISEDPLLTCKYNLNKETDEEAEKNFQSQLINLNENFISQMSGGYVWATDDLDREKNKVSSKKVNKTYQNHRLTKMRLCLQIINKYELEVREALLKIGNARCIYWPEPNLYLTYENRLNGALKCLNHAIESKHEVQQKESIHYIGSKTGNFWEALKVKKPLKNHVNKFLDVIQKILDGKETPNAKILAKGIKEIHQTHLSEKVVWDIIKWQDGINDSVTLDEIKLILEPKIKENLT
ncbi:MAG: hypothetical protein VW397_08830, partial [Candidatus Margulisiibacteriota bacterium]